MSAASHNQIVKDKRDVDVRVAFCFPDTYEIGMSNIGMRILYGLMNELPGVWCERVFAPWGDMEEKMREHAIPLYALESHDPVRAFDLDCVYDRLRNELHQHFEYAGPFRRAAAGA